MNDEMTIEQLLAAIEEKVAWFHSDEFTLDAAKDKFTEVKALAEEAQSRLMKMQNEVEVLAKDFS